MKAWLPALILAAAGLNGQSKAPIASNPVVEVKGTVAKVELVRGQGMPALEVNTSKGPVRLVLGSMRYLIEQNFNPAAGESIEAKGYQLDGYVVAIRVDLPGSKKSVQLRDQNGYPLWMGGRRGGTRKQ